MRKNQNNQKLLNIVVVAFLLYLGSCSINSFFNKKFKVCVEKEVTKGEALKSSKDSLEKNVQRELKRFMFQEAE